MSQVKRVGMFRGNVTVAEMHAGWLSLTGFSTSGIENIFWVGSLFQYQKIPDNSENILGRVRVLLKIIGSGISHPSDTA